jgi:hypothetical protein
VHLVNPPPTPRLHNVEREYETREEQAARLADALRANVMKTGAGEVTL